ncbi:hypothetical protein EV715DRAFT_246119 [Schizophyllum commune]
MVMCVAAKHGQRTRLLVLNSLSRAITRARVCTNMSASIGMRSPPPLSPSPRLGSSQSSPRLPGLSLSSRQSNASPIPRPQFDADLLRAYMKKLLATTLLNASWPEAKDRDRVKAWMKEIGERVKERMVEIQGKGFKYVVLTQINENLGQGGRADLVCHWEDSDIVAQEVFTNHSLICICIAFAIRTS